LESSPGKSGKVHAFKTWTAQQVYTINANLQGHRNEYYTGEQVPRQIAKQFEKGQNGQYYPKGFSYDIGNKVFFPTNEGNWPRLLSLGILPRVGRSAVNRASKEAKENTRLMPPEDFALWAVSKEGTQAGAMVLADPKILKRMYPTVNASLHEEFEEDYSTPEPSEDGYSSQSSSPMDNRVRRQRQRDASEIEEYMTDEEEVDRWRKKHLPPALYNLTASSVSNHAYGQEAEKCLRKINREYRRLEAQAFAKERPHSDHPFCHCDVEVLLRHGILLFLRFQSDLRRIEEFMDKIVQLLLAVGTALEGSSGDKQFI
jgi:hypothetical protein